MDANALKPDFTYLKQLAGAGWQGVAGTRHEMRGGAFSPRLETFLWQPAAVGAALGMLSAGLTGNAKSKSRVAVGGLVGSVVGFGAALAWASRKFSGCAARRTVRLVNATRDAHWLQQNPIDYA